MNDTPHTPPRARMTDECVTHRHKFSVGGHEGYLHVGVFPNGSPGEVFIKMAKAGSSLSGLMDTVAVLASLCLQYGVPLNALTSKFIYSRFEPSGFTSNPDIPVADSIIDYIFRYLGKRFTDLPREALDKPEDMGTLELPTKGT